MPRQAKELTDARIRKAAAADFPLWDGKGLRLIRSASGTLLWRLKYYRPDGRESEWRWAHIRRSPGSTRVTCWTPPAPSSQTASTRSKRASSRGQTSVKQSSWPACAPAAISIARSSVAIFGLPNVAHEIWTSSSCLRLARTRPIPH